MFPEQTPGCSSRLPPPEFRAAHSDPAAAASVTALGAALPRDHGSLRAGSTLPVTEDVMLPRRARWGPGRRGAVSRRNTQVPGSVILARRVLPPVGVSAHAAISFMSPGTALPPECTFRFKEGLVLTRGGLRLRYILPVLPSRPSVVHAPRARRCRPGRDPGSGCPACCRPLSVRFS